MITRLVLAAVVVLASTSGAQSTVPFTAYKPASFPSLHAERAMVVMLHGCGQSTADVARATRMNAAADSLRFMVVYPEQVVSANALRCWNWFVPEQSTRDKGEVGRLAALIDSIARVEGIGARRISLVGMSAGGAMGANLLVAYPERYAALAMHSGIAAMAAKDLMTAAGLMRGADADGAALGASVKAAMGEHARPLAVIALHGADDPIVSPKNLATVVAQFTAVNAGRTAPPVEHHLLRGVGHAWSGGSADAPFTAPAGQDATALILSFLRRMGAL